MIRDDRGVSTQISQVFGIAMTGILIVLLVNGAATYVQNQRTAAVETQLETVGNRLAEQLERADELGQRGGNVTVRTTVQDTLSGTGYRAVLESGSPCRTDNFRTDSCLVLDAYGADAQRAIPLNVTADLRLEHGSGGRYVIHAEGDRTGLADGAVVDRQLRIGVGETFTLSSYAQVGSPANRAPVARFGFSPDRPGGGDSIQFQADPSFDVDGDIVTYEWDFGDDGTVDAVGQNVTRQLRPGRRTVSLSVTDDGGATSNVTQVIRVTGITYGGDLENSDAATSTGEGAFTFTVTNRYGTTVEITDVLVDPADDGLTPIKNNCADEYSENCPFGDDDNDGEVLVTETPAGGEADSVTQITPSEPYIGRPVPDGGLIVGLDEPVSLANGESARVWTGAFDGDGDLTGEEADVGVRYAVGDRTNSTVITDVAGSPSIESFQILSGRGSGDRVDLEVVANEELDTVSVDLGGELSGVADDIDADSPDGGNHRHVLKGVGTVSSGTVKANLTVAERGTVPAYETRGSRSLNRSAVVFDTDYAWADAGDWDDATTSGNVVHDDVGNRRESEVRVGYPDSARAASGLAGYWPLDGSPDDVSSNGLDGTDRGSPSTSPGALGTESYDLDGVDDYVDVGTDLGDVHRGTSSMSLWVNADAGGDDTFYEAPGVTGVEDAGGENDIFWGWLDDVGHIGIRAGNDEGARSTTRVDDGDWHHVVLTYDASTGDSQVYVDGQLEDSGQTRSGPIGTDFGSLGRIDDTAGSHEHFPGRINEVRSYDRVLDSSEVQALSRTSGTLVTDWQSGSQPLGPSNAMLQYEASVPTATSINVTVAADTDGDGTVDERSDVIRLRDGQNTVSVPGLSATATDFKLEVELESDSAVQSPVLRRAALAEGS